MVDPESVLYSKQWISPTHGQVIIRPLSAFGSSMPNHKDGQMPKLKSARSPINPVDLKGPQILKPGYQHEEEDSTCSTHRGISPKPPRKVFERLGVPRHAETKSRSPSSHRSPRTPRRREKGGDLKDDLDHLDLETKSYARSLRTSPRSSRSHSGCKMGENTVTRERNRRRKSSVNREYMLSRQGRLKVEGSKSRMPSRSPRARGTDERVPSRRRYRNEYEEQLPRRGRDKRSYGKEYYYYSDEFSDTESDDWREELRRKNTSDDSLPNKPNNLGRNRRVDEKIEVDNTAVCKLEVDSDDPWGPYSPRHRIAKMEKKFGPDKEDPIDHDLELVADILQQAEKAAPLNMMPSGPDKIEVLEDDTYGNLSAIIGDVGGNPEPENIPTIMEPEPRSPSASSTIDLPKSQLALKLFDEDSGLDLSNNESSFMPSSAKSFEAKIVSTHDEPTESPPEDCYLVTAQSCPPPRYSTPLNSHDKWTFVKTGEKQLIGQVKDDKTNTIYNVYIDMEDEGGTNKYTKFFASRPVGSSLAGSSASLKDEEDIPWCSIYLLIRIVGLLMVCGGLAGLIILSLYR